MPRGGVRMGAGRPKGPPGAKKAADIAALVVETMQKAAKAPKAPTPEPPPPAPLPSALAKQYDDPRDFLRGVMNDPEVPLVARQDAAKALMPYEHAKKGETGKKEAAADKAKAIGQSRFGQASPPPLKAVSNG